MSRFDPIENLASSRHEFGEHGGVNMSIEASTTFTVMDADLMPEIFAGRLGPDSGGCYLYGRHFNPTVYVLGHQLAALEGTESAYCTASGMGAISATLTQLCDAGDHVVAGSTLYGGTYAFLNDYLPKKSGVTTTFVDVHDLAAVEAAFTDNTKALYVEGISNPTLDVADIPALADIAHKHGVMLVVDNTFSPMVLSPAKLGADVVIHSLTKFVSGASDIIGGAICGPASFVRELMDLHTGSLMLLGPTMDPRIAYQLSLRIPHLGLRMVEHSRRAQAFAERLHDLGLKVGYPGLEHHPGHDTIKRLHNPEYGFGGIFTLDVDRVETANALMSRLQNKDRFGYMAVSLGYFDTLMSCSGSSTSSELDDEAKKKAGIAPGLIRVSIGYTGTLEQRWKQFAEALKTLNLC